MQMCSYLGTLKHTHLTHIYSRTQSILNHVRTLTSAPSRHPNSIQIFMLANHGDRRVRVSDRKRLTKNAEITETNGYSCVRSFKIKNVCGQHLSVRSTSLTINFNTLHILNIFYFVHKQYCLLPELDAFSRARILNCKEEAKAVDNFEIVVLVCAEALSASGSAIPPIMQSKHHIGRKPNYPVWILWEKNASYWF